MHLLAQGKKGLSNIELGRRLGISTNAAWRLQHKLMQAMIERDRVTAWRRRAADRDRRRYIGGERTGEGAGRGRRGHTPFIIAVETSSDGRPLHTACRSCAASKLAKPNGYAPASRPERLSSATAANGFAASPSSRVSSMNATSRLRSQSCTPPCLPLGEHMLANIKNSCSPPTSGRRQTSAALPRRLRMAFQPTLCLKTIHERLAIAATTTPPMPYRLLKLAEARW